MRETEIQLKQIQDKLQRLLKLHTGVLKENQKLKEELLSVEEQTSQQQKNLDALKQQVYILQAGSGEMNDTDKKDFEKRINNYLKEVDRCIALISE